MKLEACPSCGEDPVLGGGMSLGSGDFRMVACGCGVNGPRRGTEELAAEAWNQIAIPFSRRRPGQHEQESPVEYLRRVASNSVYETEDLWGEMPSVEACLEFFELWAHSYGTDFWEGVVECISEGDDPGPARAFVARWKLAPGWGQDIDAAVATAAGGSRRPRSHRPKKAGGGS